ncbi:MAG: vWA domain-containing protein [Pyrobaculum sp.]
MGALLNVDYEDELTRLRTHEVVRYFQRLGIPLKLAKISNHIIADSFYVHYRTPILKDSKEEALWNLFLRTYINSDIYQEISKISRYNYQVSRSASIKLLRAYNSLLSRIERGAVEGVKERGDYEELSQNQLLRHEISSLLRFYMGNIKNIEKIRRSVAKALGDDVGKEAAELLFDIDIDPYRARLAKILESLVTLISGIAPELEESQLAERRGVISGVTRIRTFSDLQKATNLSKAIYLQSRELFGYKLATKSLSIYDTSIEIREKVYLLVDKSGSMFYAVYDGVAMDMTQKITWATALAVALMRKCRRVVMRFFDQMVYPPITSTKDIIKSLLKVLPLGGTDITAAVHTAIRDSRQQGLQGYKLVLITDGEDDMVNPEVLKAAKSAFREVKAILIGGTNEVIKAHVPTVKVNTANPESLRKVLKDI